MDAYKGAGLTYDKARDGYRPQFVDEDDYGRGFVLALSLCRRLVALCLCTVVSCVFVYKACLYQGLSPNGKGAMACAIVAVFFGLLGALAAMVLVSLLVGKHFRN